MVDNNLKYIADFCRKNMPGRVEKVIKTADDICKNSFLFNMPWDLERTEEAVVFENKPDWYYKLNGDDEFLYQFNRHGFLMHLAQAYCFTEDRKYSDKYINLLEDWLENVPPDDGFCSPWRSLEVGLRADNWIKSFDIMNAAGMLSEELKDKVSLSLRKHTEVLMNTHKAFQKGSNWGVIQDNGLFTIGAYCKDKEIMDIAAERLCLETELQLMNDGVHWEQSCTYHNEVLMCLLNVIFRAEKTGYTLPEELLKKAYNAAEVNIKWIKPDGEQPLLGDSDNNDIRDLLARSALLFRDSRMKGLSFAELDYDSAWLFGKNGIEEYKTIESSSPDFLCAALRDSGNYIMRDSWHKDANWLMFHNGYTGGGHSHSDKLHFSLTFGGRDVLVDSGRYNYVNCSERRYIKEQQGHNTTKVGNKKLLEVVSAWDCINPAPSVQYPFFDNEFCTLAGGGHLGYKDFPSTYTERYILYIKPDIFIISDRFRTSFSNTYFQYFHFSPEGKIENCGNKIKFSDSYVSAEMFFLRNDIKTRRIDSVYSPNYNAKTQNPAIENSFRDSGDAFALTVIYGAANNKFRAYDIKKAEVRLAVDNSLLDDSSAECIVIKTPENEYTVYFAYKEIMRPVVCSGKTATGSVTVFKDDKVIFRKW